MPEAGRLSDRAECKSDSHGCTGCSHSVIGPAVGGSPDVYINSRNALRVDDPGVHSSCCGPNTWNAQGGSPSVYANGKRLHRKGDATKHCGGLGKLTEGSSDVFAGGLGFSSVADERHPSPRAYLKGLVRDSFGTVLSGESLLITDSAGKKQIVATTENGEYYAEVAPGTCSVSLVMEYPFCKEGESIEIANIHPVLCDHTGIIEE